METAEWLSGRGLTLDSVRQFAPPIQVGECLLLAGSVAEGLANDESDLDLLMIGGQAPGNGLVLAFEALETVNKRVADLDVSVESYEPDFVESLGVKVGRILSVMDAPETADRIDIISSLGDRKLLHRLRTGIPIAGEDVIARWRSRLSVDRWPMVLAGLSLIEHFTYREDTLSHLAEDDVESAGWVNIKASTSLASAVLAATGETNPNTRWLIKLLRRSSDAIPDDLAVRVLDLLRSPPFDAEAIVGAIALADDAMGFVFEQFPTLLTASLRLTEEFPTLTHPGS